MKKILLRVLISVGFVALLFYVMRGDLPLIANVLKNVNKPLLAVSVVIFLFTVVVLAKRLQLIFAAENINISLLETSNLTFVGYFFNNFLPTSVGGDLVKVICASRVTKEPVKSLTSILMDRIFGLFTFILIPSITLLFYVKGMDNPVVPWVVYSFLVFSLFSFALLFNRDFARRFCFIEKILARIHLADKVRRVYDGLHNFKNHKLVVLKAMGLSIFGQSISIFVLYILGVALGAHTQLLYFFLLVPVVHLISMLPSLNGLGIRESAYVYFLAPYMGREYAAALGVLWLAILLLLSLIGAVIYFARNDYHVRLKDAVVVS